MDLNNIALTMRKYIFIGLLFIAMPGKAQIGEQILLSDMKVQIEATQAVNDLYNFKFKKAEQQFRWLKQKYGWHPLPYFLLGLSEWWKIMPNTRNTKHDNTFLAYMDTTISIAERLYKIENHEVEASFFLAAAHSFKGRLFSDDHRRNWRRAASEGRSALKYLEVSKGKHSLNPELMFGDALYNYFSVWIPENYPLLKPILIFFPKGDKELGIKQLKEVANNAFYTRTEAQFFLMRILGNYEKDRAGALHIAQYLHETFPDNAYFHRYYARLLYTSGKYTKLLDVASGVMARIDSGQVGYEATSGRYAAFFLGQVHDSRGTKSEAVHYYKRAIEFAEEIEATESGYYLYSLLYAGRVYEGFDETDKAKSYYVKAKQYSKRSHPVYKEARDRIKRLRRFPSK